MNETINDFRFDFVILIHVNAGYFNMDIRRRCLCVRRILDSNGIYFAMKFVTTVAMHRQPTCVLFSSKI